MAASPTDTVAVSELLTIFKDVTTSNDLLRILNEHLRRITAWQHQINARFDFLTDAMIDINTKISRIDERTDALEDLEAQICHLFVSNAPPPLAEPAPALEPKQPARRAA